MCTQVEAAVAEVLVAVVVHESWFLAIELVECRQDLKHFNVIIWLELLELMALIYK